MRLKQLQAMVAAWRGALGRLRLGDGAGWGDVWVWQIMCGDFRGLCR